MSCVGWRAVDAAVDNQSVGGGGSAQPARRRLLLHHADAADSGQRVAVHLRRRPLLQVAVLRAWRLGNRRIDVAVRLPARRLLRLVYGALQITHFLSHIIEHISRYSYQRPLSFSYLCLEKHPV